MTLPKGPIERLIKSNNFWLYFFLSTVSVMILATIIGIIITVEDFEIIKKDKNIIRLVGKEEQNFYDRSKFYQYMTALEDVDTENRIYNARFNR